MELSLELNHSKSEIVTFKSSYRCMHQCILEHKKDHFHHVHGWTLDQDVVLWPL